MPDKKITLDELAKSDENLTNKAPTQAPVEIAKNKEDINEWKAQYFIKVALVALGVIITVYGCYLTTRVLLEYKDIVLQSLSDKTIVQLPMGIVLLIIPVFISGVAFVLAASKLLTKHSKDDEDTNFDKFISALNPVLNAINIYLRNRSS